MADINYFLEKIEELKEEIENLKPDEYLSKLDSYIFTYCPRNAYYKGDYLKTMLLINNNDMETIRNCLK